MGSWAPFGPDPISICRLWAHPRLPWCDMTTLHIFTWRDVNIQYHFNVCIYIHTHTHIYIYIINLAVSCSIFMSVTSHIQPWRNMNSSVISFACWFPCSKIDFVGIPSRDRKQKWTGQSLRVSHLFPHSNSKCLSDHFWSNPHISMCRKESAPFRAHVRYVRYIINYISVVYPLKLSRFPPAETSVFPAAWHPAIEVLKILPQPSL